MTIGVLALQGDFDLHRKALDRLGLESVEVKLPRQLEQVAGLIMPGGESTTLLKLLDEWDFVPALEKFHAAGKPIFGTCAGLILLARSVSGPEQRSLGLLDAEVERNGYGRQIDSFETDLSWTEDGGAIRGVFIRAPRIRRVGPGVRVLAERDGEPVLVRNGRVLAATFHPELTEDTRVHRYFIEEMAGAPPTSGK